MTVQVSDRRRQRYLRTRGTGTALLAYATLVYPRVREAFGGGNPTLAQIFLTSPIGSDPAKQFTAHIIDETDAGFYVIQSNHSTVRYIATEFNYLR